MKIYNFVSCDSVQFVNANFLTAITRGNPFIYKIINS